ncbi:conserved Plasmodium membrane protein, unknown function [Plasmodium sp. gorilla clade G2]|uniref:conserved Plasmodium membrane protein, unknown function n=1 Tax=Plasmodium sp. gorilla clade G2 TaxID=880535 RepID=UPI000D229C0D|nr:conserved Plasmodium membrane protein, unknown function [Plasmodium sp. gorilla clade G2]SOV16981.1 conserved Plasmodium membrane protein, unknown function [Plasmodium sp. gorilla clade G2]
MSEKKSLISEILTEAEILELGLNSSMMKYCSCPFILNKKYFVKICISYLITTFLFFCVYITLIILLIYGGKTELNKSILLIIYIYIFILFYIDLLISNNIKYDLIKKYNIKEVRKRIYDKYISNSKKKTNTNNNDINNKKNNNVDEESQNNMDSNKNTNRDDDINRDDNINRDGDNINRDGDNINRDGDNINIANYVDSHNSLDSYKNPYNNSNVDDHEENFKVPCDKKKKRKKENTQGLYIVKKKEKVLKTKKEKIFSNERYYITEEKNMNHYHDITNNESRLTLNENFYYYNLYDLKDVNNVINIELLKYIQYENNNYSIKNKKYDIFLIVAGLINQINIFFDLVFLFYLYDYSVNLFFISIFIYLYYFVHMCIIIKLSSNIILLLFKIYKKSMHRSYRKKIKYCKYLSSYMYYKMKRAFAWILRNMIELRSNDKNINERKSKIFFSKYTNYNSWSIFYNDNSCLTCEINSLPLIDETDSEYEEILRKKIYSHKTTRKKHKHNPEYEKALLPTHVQIIANMSSFLSYYHILNILKMKFLSAHNIYAHITFTIVFFVWKLLYTDIVLCLLKIFFLFYTEDVLSISLFLLISVVNIVNSYLINLLDHNLLNDINMQ